MRALWLGGGTVEEYVPAKHRWCAARFLYAPSQRNCEEILIITNARHVSHKALAQEVIDRQLAISNRDFTGAGSCLFGDILGRSSAGLGIDTPQELCEHLTPIILGE